MPNDNDRIEPANEDRARGADAREPDASNRPLDPNDVVPVPAAMEPAEIDARAEVVEALRDEQDRGEPPRRPRRDRDSDMHA